MILTGVATGGLLALIPAAIILAICFLAAVLPGDPDDQ